MTSTRSVGVKIPTILLPRRDVDLTKWAVIACDQYTSQPEYWQKVEEIVGDAPSTYHMILPEVYLDTPAETVRVESIHQTMRAYLDQGILEPFEGMVYVERNVGGKTRRGLVLCLDLECYDFRKGSLSLIRATEGTILERLPPRMRIRTGAPLELPHILVLIDDPQQMILDPLAALKGGMEKAYDFGLMLGSGRLCGYKVQESVLIQQVLTGLQSLAEPQKFRRKYKLEAEQPVLLFAMGDGNHSLATAKAIWDQMKAGAGPDHPARYALVEIENVHDAGLVFEPIHRVIFNIRKDVLAALREFYPGQVETSPAQSVEGMISAVRSQPESRQRFGMVSESGFSVVEITSPPANLAVGTLQNFLDVFLKEGGAGKIDYVHGEDVVSRLGCESGCAGFYLPGIEKDQLFRTVILDGALPRKTFSMGEAHEKRFYLEARQIS